MTEPQLLAGRYELDGVVGRGGMAEVYRGHDVRLDRRVAVKALRADLARDPTFQERFRREAQSAASLNHPSIIAVYDTGEDMVYGSSVPFIVMEYVAGRTLRDMLRDDRRLLPERGLEIVAGVLRALEYSHAHGIVHRDIKPANIMITTSREVKVMDFGIARALHDASSTMTQTAQVVGTAQYLSPEQARGERVDARSDVYSTGCVLYEVLTGNPPFRGDSPVAIAYQHVREEPVPPSQIDPDAPAWADPIVLRAMAKDSNERYQDAAEMRADVQRALDGQQVAPAAPASSTQLLGGPSAGTTQAIQATEEPPRRAARRRWPWVAVPLALLFLALMAVGGWYLTRGLRDTGPEQVQVPRVIGFTEQQARSELSNNNLEAQVERAFSAETEQGRVMKQVPAPAAQIAPGETVTLTVSKGRDLVTVPNNLNGMTQQEARQALQQADLNVQNVQEKSSQERAEGEVMSTRPPGGQQVPRNSGVVLVVSSGAPTVGVPDVVGDHIESAHAELRDAGFEVRVRRETSGEYDPGIVIRQDPSGGSEEEENSLVTVVIAQQPTQQPTGPPTSPSTPPPGDGDDEGEGDDGGGIGF